MAVPSCPGRIRIQARVGSVTAIQQTGKLIHQERLVLSPEDLETRGKG